MVTPEAYTLSIPLNLLPIAWLSEGLEFTLSVRTVCRKELLTSNASPCLSTADVQASYAIEYGQSSWILQKLWPKSLAVQRIDDGHVIVPGFAGESMTESVLWPFLKGSQTLTLTSWNTASKLTWS